ncbi:gamma-glutamyltransferase [Methylophaga sulfidovorans]|uniref:Glutathione hydrolase proenzyme n=1 Tax=Methylophaga sulfidovorans TaxID=45496 RepID=A0A1I3V3W1_9GAMM|nr:gamma-glutamyltransferase [Methylophaga sulfidovorans]SFJ88857.1 gamma-glutamyltranspeptidase / glutathione hydrolase [Methylophaga sulfidovorans]
MRLLHLLCLGFCLWFTPVWASEHDVAVASAQPLATQAGIEILQQGGNAFDAAVAVTAALAVVEPAGSGLGGGGFWLLHEAETNKDIMVDGREMAPGKASAEMYLNQQGEFEQSRSLNGPLAAGIPGVPAGIVYLSEHYGKLPLKQSLAPAIRYALEGFAVGQHYTDMARFRLPVLSQYAASRQQFLKDGQVPSVGTIIKQPDLAHTLNSIAEQGTAGFYQGDIAQRLVEAVQQHGGIWTLDDLQRYEVKPRQPIKGLYQGYTITSAALPSSGGIVLINALNQLSAFDLANATTTQKRHLVIEAMRRAYRDRSRFLGDADFIDIPDYLTSADYGKQLSDTIDPVHATPSSELVGKAIEGEDTTHFSIMDSQGNRVAATLSVNYPFGSGFVAQGTGVLLNDEMDDFSAPSGAANVYGLVGNEANAIAPYKRPLSSMTPTFVENNDHLLITGTPGGSRIISMVLLSVLDFIEGKNAQAIVTAPRYHHQYLPDEVQVENVGFSEQELDALKQRGHHITPLSRQYGDMHIIIEDKVKRKLSAASDPRGEGQATITTLEK